MQTRFLIREIDVSKGYCLVVTDKNHSKVTFGFNNLDVQLQRLEQFLIYSDDAHRELATVNLLVQRNIPVTFQKSSTEVINDTIQPEESPRVMKGSPVKAASKPKSKPTPAANKPGAVPSATPTTTPAKRGLLQLFLKKN